jgi:hypothetical protein
MRDDPIPAEGPEAVEDAGSERLNLEQRSSGAFGPSQPPARVKNCASSEDMSIAPV